MATDRPALSLVMSVRNAGPTVEETLRSILAERDIDLRVELIDNGCTDDTIPKALALGDDRIRVHEGPKKTLSAAINFGYSRVETDYVTRFDGDDLMTAGSLARRLHWLHAHPEYGAVCGSFETMDEHGRNRVRMATGDDEEEITDELRGGKIRTHINTFVYRRSVVEAMGGSREWFAMLDDRDFQYRIAEHTRVRYLPERMFSYRLIHGSITHSIGTATRRFYDWAADEFQRQRRETGEDDLMRGHPPEPPTGDDSEKIKSPTEQLVGHLVADAWRQHGQGDRVAALGSMLRALRKKPLDARLVKQFVLLAVKPTRA